MRPPSSAAVAPAARPPRARTGLTGRPGDGWWLWGPVPVLAGVALVLHAAGLPDIGLGGLLLINFMHLAATWTRLYGEARTRMPFAAYGLPVVLLGVCGALVAVGWKDAVILLVFMGNLPHIGLQNYGFIRMAEARRGDAGANAPVDRWLDKAFQGLVPTGLAFWFATRPGAHLFDGDRLGLDRLPPAVFGAGGALLAVLAAATFLRIAWRWARGRPPSAERVLLHLLWGPGALACFVLLPVGLAAVPLAGAHYIQYLVVVRRYHQQAARTRPTPWARVHPLAYLLMLAVLAPGIPALVDLIFARYVVEAGFVIGSAASLHHFLVDGLIWRLRNRRTARIMLGS